MSSCDTLTTEKELSGLISLLKEYGSAVLAFSGGVDSTFLLKAMSMAGMRLLAITAVSETMPEGERDRAVSFAEELGVAHLIIHTDELHNEEFAKNPPERCFYCKEELFKKLRAIAKDGGYENVFDGTNSDDLSDYRPGRKAAGLYKVISPLAERGLSKTIIRELSRAVGLPDWDRPSSPCLSSRFPYGHRITLEGLARVARAEALLRNCGLRDLRVRDHGDTARIEVGEKDIVLFFDTAMRKKVVEEIKALGYIFVSLDLEGYRSGSLNRLINSTPQHTG